MSSRGTKLDLPNRFVTRSTEAFDEALNDDYAENGEPSPRTEFYRDSSKSILTRNESPDVGFEVSINAYRGCEHGCVYCYARPTHEYLGHSAGLDFETKIYVKEDAPHLLRQELANPKYEPKVINLSGITDCYQPAERRFRLTRGCLEVLEEFKNPFSIITKNFLVTRDLDIFKRMAEINGVMVLVTVTSLDAKLAAKLEPRTSQPAYRLKAVETLAKAGIPVGVLMAPVIPGFTDEEIPSVLKAAKDAGASTVHYVPLRLPYGLSVIFENWLEENFPDRKDKVLNRIRDIRGGKINDSSFETRMRGTGIYAEQIRALFHLHVQKNQLNKLHHKLTTEHFKVPESVLLEKELARQEKKHPGQLDLFGPSSASSDSTSKPPK
jgi:DNA repair photolyase